MYLAIFWQHPFLMMFVICLIASFICSFCYSAALQCFHSVQIIKSPNISLTIKKKSNSSTMTRILSRAWIIEFLCIHVESLTLYWSPFFIILCCFSRNTNLFLIVFKYFVIHVTYKIKTFIKSYVLCLNKRKFVLIYRKCIVLTLLNNKIN